MTDKWKLQKKLRDLQAEEKAHREMLKRLTPGGLGFKNCTGRLENTLLDIRNTKNLLEMTK